MTGGLGTRRRDVGVERHDGISAGQRVVRPVRHGPHDGVERRRLERAEPRREVPRDEIEQQRVVRQVVVVIDVIDLALAAEMCRPDQRAGEGVLMQ